MAETSSLLNCRTRKGSGGSNPPLTAKAISYGEFRAIFFLHYTTDASLLAIWGMMQKKKSEAAAERFLPLQGPRRSARGMPKEKSPPHRRKPDDANHSVFLCPYLSQACLSERDGCKKT